MNSIATSAAWYGLSVLGLLGVMLLLRRLTERISALLIPAFVLSAILAVVLSAISSAATRSATEVGAVAALVMSALVIALWVPQTYKLARRQTRVRVLPPDGASAVHKAAYRLAGAGSLVALGGSAQLAFELWEGALSKRLWGGYALGFLASAFVVGACVAWTVRRHRYRATIVLLPLTVVTGVVGRWGVPAATAAAVLFLLATILNALALRGAPYLQRPTDLSAR